MKREERWVPVAESGDEWKPRSREEAEQAMREVPAGGCYLDGEPWDGVVEIRHEVRYVTDWREEPA